MGIEVTSIILAVAVVVAVFAGWRGAHPPDPLKGPRLVPWRLIMVTGALAAMLMLVHLVNLFGVSTGR